MGCHLSRIGWDILYHPVPLSGLRCEEEECTIHDARNQDVDEVNFFSWSRFFGRETVRSSSKFLHLLFRRGRNNECDYEARADQSDRVWGG